MAHTVVLFLVAAFGLGACGPLLRAGVQAPEFEVAPGRTAELRVLAPTLARPLGGLSLRIWTRVSNPNPVGLTLLSLSGDLQLDGTRAATAEFPLGIPLLAQGDTIIPLDIVIDPRDVPGIAPVVTRAAQGQPVNYGLVGRVTVDAGLFGTPTFGPMNLISGSVQLAP